MNEPVNPHATVGAHRREPAHGVGEVLRGAGEVKKFELDLE